jgi:hypothetical protein
MSDTAEPHWWPRAVCPDCAEGKHGACVGSAWDDDTDSPAVCQCYEHDHDEEWSA